MRVLLTGGGTGGHVNPALAIADTIKANVPDSVIEYVGTSKGIENKLVPKAGYKLHHVEIRGIKRSLSLSNIKTAYYVLTAPSKAARLIREFKPDVVIGTGGYVCWPVVKAAADMGIPTALHESNAAPGIAVKMLSSRVDRIYLNFEKTAEGLNCADKLLHVGNPLRGRFSDITKAEARQRLEIGDEIKYVLLTYGGSLGATVLNNAAIEVMEKFTSKHPEIMHYHATGAREFDKVNEELKLAGLDKCPNIKIVDYFYDMPVRMAAADLVVCRAGAMTVSEVALLGKCTMFIPSPNVTDNHQYKNAKVLADAGAAMLTEERELEINSFIDKISETLCPQGDETRQNMEKKIRDFAVEDANKRILDDILRLVGNTK